MKKQQSGRSMVEMLAVLGIIGILTIAGFAGYSLAITRLRINNILDTATKLASQGIGGKSYFSLESAGLEKPEGIDMALEDTGTVCLKNFPQNDQDGKFFSAFKAQATDYTVSTQSVKVIVSGTQVTVPCKIALKFSNKLLNQ